MVSCRGPSAMLLTIDLDICNGCGQCDPACPTDVIHCDPKTGKPRIIHPEACCTCFLCELVCPVDCVDVYPVLQKRPLPW